MRSAIIAAVNGIISLSKVAKGVTESIYILANEPSAGMYRVNENVQKAVPELSERKVGCVG